MRTIAVALSIALVSCVLVVSPEEYGTVCRFEGETSQCGACVAEKCRAQVDGCCRDETCDGAMSNLDACAARHDASCGVLTGGGDALSQCVARECGGVCLTLAGTSTTSCREPRLGEGAACTCEVGGAPNDFVCGTRAVKDTLCCAPKGWPATGLACACRPLNCSPTGDGCFCALGDFTPKQRECTGAKQCCVDKDKCTCRARECFAFERPVDACNVGAVECGEGQDRVESCSVRVNE